MKPFSASLQADGLEVERRDGSGRGFEQVFHAQPLGKTSDSEIKRRICDNQKKS